MSAVLECKALTKSYGASKALNDFSVRLGSSRIVGLLGPNGSGKSTLIKLACGLLTPTGGCIEVLGQAPGVETKKHISYLPERPYLPVSMCVREVIDFFSDFYTDFSVEKASSMLADLQIAPQDKLVTMSKGTREKVHLALVMSRAASLYLLDEPIGGVDPAARDYILDTIIRNYSENATLVLSTHLIGDVEKILDDVVMMHQGTLVMQGSVDDIRAQQGKSVDTIFREVFKCTQN